MTLPMHGQDNTQEANAADGSLANYLRDCEHKFILQSLKHHQWHFGNTATALGISRKNLWEKMKKLDIHADKAVED
jgi:DNA-binding NtrC family response regulator